MDKSYIFVCVVFLVIILFGVIMPQINNEQISCSKVCKAQGYEYNSIDKELGFCFCEDTAGVKYASKYYNVK